MGFQIKELLRRLGKKNVFQIILLNKISRVELQMKQKTHKIN